MPGEGCLGGVRWLRKARSLTHTIHLQPLLHNHAGAGPRRGRGPSQIKVGQRFSCTRCDLDNFTYLILSRFDISWCLTVSDNNHLFQNKILWHDLNC